MERLAALLIGEVLVLVWYLGLEYIHMLTQHDRQHLRIELTDWSGTKRFIEYEHFYISDRDEKYRLLSIGSFTGNAGQHHVKTLTEPYVSVIYERGQ